MHSKSSGQYSRVPLLARTTNCVAPVRNEARAIVANIYYLILLFGTTPFLPLRFLLPPSLVRDLCNDIVPLVSRNRKLFTWAEDPSPVGRIMDAEIVSEFPFFFFSFISIHLYPLICIRCLFIFISYVSTKMMMIRFQTKVFRKFNTNGIYDIGLFFTFDYLFTFICFIKIIFRIIG